VLENEEEEGGGGTNDDAMCALNVPTDYRIIQ